MSGWVVAIAMLTVKAVILYFTWSTIAKPVLEDVKMVVTNASVVTFLFFCPFMALVGFMDWKVHNGDYNGSEKEKE